MGKIYPLKVDAWVHLLPPKYADALFNYLPSTSYWQWLHHNPAFNMDHVFQLTDKFEGLVMVMSVGGPPLETVADPQKAVEFARMANDETAEWVAKYPGKFATAVACLPMNDMDAALKEADRAIKDLHFRGIQMFTPTASKPIDSPEFIPLYEKMCQYDLPIYLHPNRQRDIPDYKGEKESKYLIYHIFGWPYETSAALTRLVFSGVMEKFPNLKIVAHHNAAMIPFFESRIIEEQYRYQQIAKPVYAELTKAPIDYYKKFYCDVEIRTPAAVRCTYEFFGTEHVLFATGMPYGPMDGYCSVRNSINCIEQLPISEAEKQMIFMDNAYKLLRLPLS